ncbi:unnamed protein product [Pleuronectes platessa]|uniref:Uncharacterized protein n=1 Tax=Pleuronectes platessa TaxID=8262 RepID=A0A9N7U387_PLEPL|nr:unnamed protein product [Pleuronectes platessa]
MLREDGMGPGLPPFTSAASQQHDVVYGPSCPLWQGHIVFLYGEVAKQNPGTELLGFAVPQGELHHPLRLHNWVTSVDSPNHTTTPVNRRWPDRFTAIVFPLAASVTAEI